MHGVVGLITCERVVLGKGAEVLISKSQKERQDDKREDGEQREDSGVVEESQNKHMRMTHDVRTTNTRLEPRMCV